MSDMKVLIINAVITFFSFFVAAPVLLNAVSLFGVQKTFAKVMVEEGVVPEEEVKRLYPGKQVGGVVVTAIVVGALVFAASKVPPFGFICLAFGLGLGCLRYRKVVQFNSLTVQRFRNSFKDVMDSQKFNRYVDSHF